MIQGQAVKILLLSAGPISHRKLNDGVMDIVYPRCQPIVFSARAVSPRSWYGLLAWHLCFITPFTTSN